MLIGWASRSPVCVHRGSWRAPLGGSVCTHWGAAIHLYPVKGVMRLFEMKGWPFCLGTCTSLGCSPFPLELGRSGLSHCSQRKLINGPVFTKCLLGQQGAGRGDCWGPGLWSSPRGCQPHLRARRSFKCTDTCGHLLVTQAWGRGVAGKVGFRPVAPRNWFGDRSRSKVLNWGLRIGRRGRDLGFTHAFMCLFSREMFPEPSSGVPGNG